MSIDPNNFRTFADIARYSYSPKELESHVLRSDSYRFVMPTGPADVAFEKFSNDFFRTSGAIASLHASPLNGRFVYSLLTLRDHLYVRRTDQILRKALNISRPDRNNEVRQLIKVIESEPEYKILRADIESFFESVNFKQVIDRLESENFRNHSTIAHLRSINSHLQSRFGYHGLPRGLAISSTLADYAIQEVDVQFSANQSTIYYARYVDDICVIHLGDNRALRSQLVALLAKQGLGLNQSKTLLLQPPYANPLEFLGYSINLAPGNEVSISDKKILKAKRRIALTLRAFAADTGPTAYAIFRDRLRFLSSVVELNRVDRSTPVFSGFRHVYRECTPNVLEAQLTKLDRFLHSIINSRRYRLGIHIRARLTPIQLRQIRKLSFRSGYSRKIVARFKPDRIALLTKAWRYE